jgi:hypothetical protein
MQKREGANCPKCNAHPCAETVMRGEQPRWQCNNCGACGDLLGEVAIRSGYKKPAVKGPTHHKPMGTLGLVILCGLLPACGQKDLQATAVNKCILSDELAACAELYEPADQEVCRKNAPLTATRVASAVPPSCR